MKPQWSEKARQAGLLLATAWGLLAIIVVVLAIYAAQQDKREAALADASSVSALEITSLPETTMMDQSAAAPPPSSPPRSQPDSMPLNAPASLAALPEPEPQQADAQTPKPVWLDLPEIEPKVAEPKEAEPQQQAAVSEQVPPVESRADEAQPMAAPTKPVQVSQASPAPTPVFVIFIGAGESPALINVLPPQSGVVLGHFDDSTANFITRARARGIKVLLPLPVGGAAPLPNLNAEPDENRRLFAAFLAGLPKVDGLYVGAKHPFLKDLASFAALMAEAKDQGLAVIGTVPENLKTPTTPMPVHRMEHGQMVHADRQDFAKVLARFSEGQGDVTIVTGPADMGFAQAFKSFAAKQSGFVFVSPEGFR